MKKTALALILLVCLTLTGCGQKDEAVLDTEVMIKAIKTVTIDSGEDIAAAERFYGKLTPDQKSQVSNYDTLLQARKAYDSLLLCGTWVWYTGDRSVTLTLGEDGGFAMSDGTSGTYAVTDAALELRINGTGEPVLLTKETRNGLMHLTTSAVDYIRPEVLTVEEAILAPGNWSRYFELCSHIHVERDSLGTVTDFWNCAFLRLREEYAGLAAPGTEISVSLRCTGRDVRSLYSAADDKILFVEDLSAPAEATAQVTLTAEAFEAYDCCPSGYELVMGNSTQYQNTVFRVLRLLEDFEITEMTGSFCFYGQLVK